MIFVIEKKSLKIKAIDFADQSAKVASYKFDRCVKMKIRKICLIQISIFYTKKKSLNFRAKSKKNLDFTILHQNISEFSRQKIK